MAIQEIPRAFKYQCDLCKDIHVQENAGGHYSNSRPPHWITITVGASSYDYQGSAVADATFSKLLCPVCGPKVVAAINAVRPLEKDNGDG